MRLAAYAVALFFGLLVMPVMAGEAEIAAIKAVLAASPLTSGCSAPTKAPPGLCGRAGETGARWVASFSP